MTSSGLYSTCPSIICGVRQACTPRCKLAPAKPLPKAPHPDSVQEHIPPQLSAKESVVPHHQATSPDLVNKQQPRKALQPLDSPPQKVPDAGFPIEKGWFMLWFRDGVGTGEGGLIDQFSADAVAPQALEAGW